MSPDELQATVEKMAEYLSCGNLEDAGTMLGTLRELVEHEPGRRSEIGCMFDEVFESWRMM